MQRIIITGAVAEFHSGIVELTPDQAASRTHCLSDLGDGYYQINRTIQFKFGEQLGYDGEINKAQAELFTSAGARKKKQAKTDDAV